MTFLLYDSTNTPIGQYVLLTPTVENVRIWTECTRMRPDEIEDNIKEARELAEVFTAIAGILETMLPGGDSDAG